MLYVFFKPCLLASGEGCGGFWWRTARRDRGKEHELSACASFHCYGGRAMGCDGVRAHRPWTTSPWTTSPGCLGLAHGQWQRWDAPVAGLWTKRRKLRLCFPLRLFRRQEQTFPTPGAECSGLRFNLMFIHMLMRSLLPVPGPVCCWSFPNPSSALLGEQP